MSEILSFDDLFNFSDPTELEKAKKQISDLNAVYKTFLIEAKKGSASLQKALKNLTTQLRRQKAALKALSPANQKQQKEIENITNQVVKNAKVFKQLTQEKQELTKQIKTLESQQKKLQKTIEKITKAQQDNKKTTEAEKGSLKDLTDQLKEARKERDKTAKEINGDLNPAYTTAAQKVAGLEKKIKDIKDENREAAKSFNENAGSINDLRAILRKATKEYDNLSKEERENEKIGGLLQKQILELVNELKKLEKQTGRTNRNVGNYKDSILSAAKESLLFAGSIVGVTSILDGLITIFRDGFNTFTNFGFQMAQVKAISGATDEQFKSLEINAKELGRTTQFTASQVGELQIVLSKLGFKPEEIQNTTKAVLELATATGEGLGETATTVGAVIRGFNLETTEAARISDVMSKAFTSSGLDLSNFTEALKDSIPFAQGSNLSFETLSSSLGILSDNVITGTRAGTAMKNILGALSNENSKLSKFLGFTVKSSDDFIKALTTLKNRGFDSTAALQLLGKTGAGSLNILVQNSEKLQKLNTTLDNSKGAATEMAAVMRDTLKGSLDSLNSAFEGLILQLFEELEPSIKTIVTSLTDLLTALTKLPETVEKNKVETAAFAGALLLLNIRSIESTGSTVANTISTIANTAGKAKNKTITELLAIAQKRLNNVIKANPYAVAITLITALAAAYFAFKDRIEGSSEAIKKNNDFTAKVTQNINKERAALNLLFDRLKSSNISFDERNQIIKKINTQYKKYLPNLLTEKSSLQDIEKAQKAANLSLIKNIILKSEQEEVTKQLQKQAERNTKTLERETKLNFEIEQAKRRVREEEEKFQKLVSSSSLSRERAEQLQRNIILATNKVKELESQKEINEQLKDTTLRTEDIRRKTDELLKLYGLNRDILEDTKPPAEPTKESLKIETDKVKIFKTRKQLLKDIETAQTNLNKELAKAELLQRPEKIEELNSEIKQLKTLLGLDLAVAIQATEEKFKLFSNTSLQLFIDARQKLLKQRQSGEITERQFNQRLRDLDEETANERNLIELQRAKEKLNIIKSSNDSTESEILEAERAVLEAQKNIRDEDLQNFIETQEKKKAAQRELINVLTEAKDTAINIINQSFEARQADRERELEALTRQQENEIFLAGNNEEAKQEIRERFLAEEKRIKQDQARIARKQALFNKAATISETIVNTAAGVVRALKDFPFPFSAVIASLIGGIGAAQTIAVAAQPIPAIPQFKTGRKGGEQTWAIVNEEGQEIGVNKQGEMRLLGAAKAKGGDLEYLQNNESVLTAKESKPLLNLFNKRKSIDLNESLETQYNSILKGITVNQTTQTIDYTKMEKAFLNAQKKRPIQSVNINEEGFKTFIQENNLNIEWMNNRSGLNKGNEF